ncbi:hypothetical protein C0J52_17498 [Blattella germanica]|nr:hypothetical protein C0J52_17498 [Blattella germanica]
MTEISLKLRNGPKYFDRKNIQAEISNLRDETAAVAQELQSVEKALTILKQKYSLMLKISANSELNTNEFHKLSNLRKVM